MLEKYIKFHWTKCLFACLEQFNTGVCIDTVGPIVNKEEIEQSIHSDTVLALMPLSWFYGWVYISRWMWRMRNSADCVFLV